MTIQEAVLEQLQQLPPEDQENVLKYARSLQRSKERRDPQGMFAQRGVHISAEEIAEARREAWAHFPRDLPEGAGS